MTVGEKSDWNGEQLSFLPQVSNSEKKNNSHRKKRDDYNNGVYNSQIILVKDNASVHIEQKNLDINETGKRINRYRTILMLYNVGNLSDMSELEPALRKINVKLTKGMGEVPNRFKKNKNIASAYDYVGMIFSVQSLKDYPLMCDVIGVFQIKRNRNKIIPLIVEDKIYEPEIQGEIVQCWDNRISAFNEGYYQKDHSISVLEKLRKMQEIRNCLEDIFCFATDIDKKSDLSVFDKIKKRVKEDEEGQE